jgi:hypothetical protein
MASFPYRHLASFPVFAFVAAVAFYPLVVSAGTKEDTTRCERRVAGVGFPRPSRELAELSAIGKWLEAAGRVSDDMPAWHRARGKSMKCEEIGTLGRVTCTVVARPCYDDESAETTSGKSDAR